jgi:2-dehydropantoate 2-reductase
VPIFGVGPEGVARPDTVVETLLDRLLAASSSRTSTDTILQDWTKGRRSEVDDINSHVSPEGASIVACDSWSQADDAES